jgi:hypothetical protein
VSGIYIKKIIVVLGLKSRVVTNTNGKNSSMIPFVFVDFLVVTVIFLRLGLQNKFPI